MNEQSKVRLYLINALAQKHPAHHIGRTALMKYMYFLQTLRGKDLGYNFTMYSYGPFDADVLSDLSSAEVMGMVTSTLIPFYGGYGYQIEAAKVDSDLKERIDKGTKDYAADMDWVLKMFGEFNSAELELASTIVFVDRELAESGNTNPKAEIVSLVHDIKPHFSEPKIQQFVEQLAKKMLLVSYGEGSTPN